MKTQADNPIRHVSTFQRGDTWSYRFEKARVDGKRQRAQRGGYATQEDALLEGIRAYEAYQAGTPEESPIMSTADFLDLWFDRTKLNVRNATLELREKSIRLHLKPFLGALPLTGISPQRIEDFVQEKRKDGYSYQTVKKILSVLSVALDYAVWPMQKLDENPAKLVKVPGKEFAPLSHQEARRRLEDDEIDKLFTLYPFGTAYYMPFLLALYFGTRLGETIGFTWEDVDLNKRILSVRHQIQRLAMHGRHDIQYLCAPKTQGSIRPLAFEEKEMLPFLLRWKRQQEENERKLGEDYYYNYLVPAVDYQGRPIQQIISQKKRYKVVQGTRVDFLCTHPNGKHLCQESFSYVCSKIRKHGIHGFNFHTLRHTCITMLAESEVMPTDIMARAGHTDYETTLTYYIDNRLEMQEKPVQILSKKLGQLLGVGAAAAGETRTDDRPS